MERGVLLPGQELVLHIPLPWPVPWRGHSSFASQRGTNTESGSLPVTAAGTAIPELASLVTGGAAESKTPRTDLLGHRFHSRLRLKEAYYYYYSQAS